MDKQTKLKQAQNHRRQVLERLLRVWSANPHMRLGQLLQRTTNGVKVEYLFDDELLQLFESGLTKRERRAINRELPLQPLG